MIRVALFALALLPTFAACGGGDGASPAGETAASTRAQAEPPPRQPPQVITEADTGATFSLPTGGETSMRLSSEYVWSEPAVDGGAVQLVPVDYLQDPGFSEWVVQGVAPGTATIVATGTPACAGQDGCPDAPLRFEVRITVAQ